MDDFTHGTTADLAMSGKARRSTRIFKPVRLKVFGESRVGTSQHAMEHIGMCLGLSSGLFVPDCGPRGSSALR